MRYSVVLFDLDGTLIDTNHLIVTSFQHVLKQVLGHDVSTEVIYTHFGEPLQATMARYSPEKAEELVDAYRAFNMKQHDALIRRFDGICEALEGLKCGGVKIGIVTSKRVEPAWRGLRVCGLAHCIDVLVGVDETERHKPDPEPALLALRRLQSHPGDHVLMVGDSRFDLMCGRSAGLRTAAVSWTVQSREEIDLIPPDYWIESPSDLLALVLPA